VCVGGGWRVEQRHDLMGLCVAMWIHTVGVMVRSRASDRGEMF
jgi:hypothetical protein